jgi:NAD(P)-dependent dehydrogenase (short-subunit alcohol dehydrogenase family)
MSLTDASELLRPGLLQGVSVLLAGTHPAADSAQSPGAAVHAVCTELGAHVSAPLPASAVALGVEEAAIDEPVERVLAERGSIELLVVDGAGLFACAMRTGAPEEHAAALRACLDGSWSVTRAVVNRAFLAPERGGRIVYLAPAPNAGGFSEPARAGLENLARTLSIEWASHAITLVTIAPGASTPADEVAALTAYLASPAGAYFSGCQLDLRGNV